MKVENIMPDGTNMLASWYLAPLLYVAGFVFVEIREGTNEKHLLNQVVMRGVKEGTP